MSIQRMCLLLFSIGINNVVLSLITGSIEDENGNYLKYIYLNMLHMSILYLYPIFYVTIHILFE